MKWILVLAVACGNPERPSPPPPPVKSTSPTMVRETPDADQATHLAAVQAYDRADYDRAKGLARRVLADHPGDVSMLRILISIECISGDLAAAKLYFKDLKNDHDRSDMKTRCTRYGIDF